MGRDGTSEFDDFFAATYQRVVGQVYLMTGNLAEVEDAVQDAFARAWQRWDRFGDYEQPEAWVRLVAYRIMVSGWRKAANRLVAHRRAGTPEAMPELGPDHVALIEALRRITPDQRRVVVLHHLIGLSVDEVAAETAASPGTVKSRLSRGRRALAELLDDGPRPPGLPGVPGLPGDGGGYPAGTVSATRAPDAGARKEGSDHA